MHTPVKRESPETRSTGSGASSRQAKRSHDKSETLVDVRVKIRKLLDFFREPDVQYSKDLEDCLVRTFAAHTKSTRQSLVTEIREKMPEPWITSRMKGGGNSGRERLAEVHNNCLYQINLILTEIEGESDETTLQNRLT